MRVLITGSNGFVGSSLAKIAKDKYIVAGLGRGTSDRTGVNEYYTWDLGKEICPENLKGQKFDVIIHAAACLDKNNNSEELILANCLGAHRIFTFAQEADCKCLILLSGIPIVGTPTDVITEESSLAPRSMYLATKAFQEMVFNQMKTQKSDCRVINLRIPSPIGPGQPEKTIVPIFVRKALLGEPITLAGKGTRKQNYVDVRDIYRAIDRIIADEKVSGTFNIGSDTPISNIELAQICVRLAGTDSEIVFSGNPDPTDDVVWDVDCTKLKNAVGYEQKYSMEMTIADMIKAAKEAK